MGFLFPPSSRLILLSCLAKEKKQKNPPPPARLATWDLLSGKPQAVEYLAAQVRHWAGVYVAPGNFRQFLMSEAMIPGSRGYCASVSGHVHVPQKCVSTPDTIQLIAS